MLFFSPYRTYIRLNAINSVGSGPSGAGSSKAALPCGQTSPGTPAQSQAVLQRRRTGHPGAASLRLPVLQMLSVFVLRQLSVFRYFIFRKPPLVRCRFLSTEGEGRREEGADGARCRTPRAAPRAERARGRGAGRRKPRAQGRARPSREPLGSTAPGVCVKPHLRACEWERRSSPSFEVSSRKQVTQV